MPAEVTVVSAHRTPDRMLDYARGAAGRGIQVQLGSMIHACLRVPEWVCGCMCKSSGLDATCGRTALVQHCEGAAFYCLKEQRRLLWLCVPLQPGLTDFRSRS